MLLITGTLSGFWYGTILTKKLPYSAGLRDLEERRAAQAKVSAWQDRLAYINLTLALLGRVWRNHGEYLIRQWREFAQSGRVSLLSRAHGRRRPDRCRGGSRSSRLSRRPIPAILSQAACAMAWLQRLLFNSRRPTDPSDLDRSRSARVGSLGWRNRADVEAMGHSLQARPSRFLITVPARWCCSRRAATSDTCVGVPPSVSV